VTAAAWLGEWHSERGWLDATHKTHIRNGIIGLHEANVARIARPMSDLSVTMIIPAPLRGTAAGNVQGTAGDGNDHWNFNAAGFNPGGNHGSFLRISTIRFHAGWSGCAEGLAIERAYDSLSFVRPSSRSLGFEGRAN